jgi:hypothetical protein
MRYPRRPAALSLLGAVTAVAIGRRRAADNAMPAQPTPETRGQHEASVVAGAGAAANADA